MDGNKILVLDDVSVRYRKQDSRSTSDIVKRILGKSPRNNEFWALKTYPSASKGAICSALSAKTAPANQR